MNRNDNEFRKSIHYDIPQPVRSNNTRNNQNMNTDKRNIHNRTIKNQSNPYQGKFKENEKLKKRRALAIGLATLAVSAGIGIAVYNNSQNNKNHFNATDIEAQIRDSALNEITMDISEDDLVFDGTNFIISKEAKCDRPELYKVLSNSELDEKLNEYLEKPTSANKEKLSSDLNGKENELAKLNFELLKASLADSMGTTIDNISITYTDKRLLITTPGGEVEYWNYRDKINDTELPKDYANIISNIAKQYEKSKLGNESNLDAKELIDAYSEIKPLIVEHNLTIANRNRLCLQNIKDGEYYDYSKGLFGSSNIKELEDDGR